MSTQKKKKKKDKDWLEAEFMAFLQSSLKAALDAAMKDLFRDWQ